MKMFVVLKLTCIPVLFFTTFLLHVFAVVDTAEVKNAWFLFLNQR